MTTTEYVTPRVAGVPGPGWSLWDGARLLVVFAVVLLVIPSRLVIGALGGAGAPATMVGIGALLWWVWHQVSRTSATDQGFQPVRFCYLAFAAAVAASFVAASVRPIDPQEFSTAVLGMVALAAGGGVLLVANDGIPDFERLVRVVRVVVVLGAGIASLGVVQFITGDVIVDRISIPGLSANHTSFSLVMRQGFTRPAGTATHPIEYGAAITMILPLALALAVGDLSRGRVARWLPVALMGVCVPLSISRSALLSGAIGVGIMLWSWPKTARRTAFVVLFCFSVGIYLFVPGMLGSLIGLFTSVGQDSSVDSRTGSYAIAGQFIEHSPIIGRGFSTFLPSYRILDNQYLGLLVETGVVGVTAFLALVGAALWCAIQVRRRSTDALGRQVGQGLMAGVASGAVTMALFDGLSFPMASGMMFLLMGLAGGARRCLTTPSSATALTSFDILAAVGRRWYLAALGIAATAGLVGIVHAYPGVYVTQANLNFLAPATEERPASFDSASSSVIATAGLVERLTNAGVEKPQTSSTVTLVGQGVREGQSVELPDSGGQWAHNFDRPYLIIQVAGPSSQAVQVELDAMVNQIEGHTESLQVDAGVAPAGRITTELSPAAPLVRYAQGYRQAAVLFAGLLGLVLSTWLVVILDQRAAWFAGLRGRLRRPRGSGAQRA